MKTFATCFNHVLPDGGEACCASCADRDCVCGGRVRSLVVVLIFVLFCLPVFRVRLGGCPSEMLGVSVAVDCVTFSVAGRASELYQCAPSELPGLAGYVGNISTTCLNVANL